MSNPNVFLIRRSGLLVVAVTLILVGAFEVQAQTTGTIYGTISDPNGAAISGATVTVTNLETNLKRTATTGAEGSYTVTLVPVGKYSIAVEAQGFKPYEQKAIEP